MNASVPVGLKGATLIGDGRHNLDDRDTLLFVAGLSSPGWIVVSSAPGYVSLFPTYTTCLFFQTSSSCKRLRLPGAVRLKSP